MKFWSVLALLGVLVWESLAFNFEGTEVLPVNNTVDIAVRSFQEDMNFFVFYHTTTRPCSDCDKYAIVLFKFLQKYRGLYKAFHIDCGKMEMKDSSARIMMTRCNRSEDHLLPHLDLYVPPREAYNKMKNNIEIAEEKLYDGPADIDFLEKWSLGWLVNYGKGFATKSDLMAYLNEDYVAHKALVFVGEKGITPDMKALTAYFKGRMDFAFMDSSLHEVCDEYNIEKFPAMVVLSKDLTTGTWSKPRHYKDEFKFFKMRNFLTKFAHKEKRIKPEHSFYDEDRNFEQELRYLSEEERERRIEQREKEKKTLFEMTSANFHAELDKNIDQVVLIHVFTHKGGKHKEWESITRKLKGLVKIYEVNPGLPENKDLMEKEFMNLTAPMVAMYPKGDRTKRNKLKRFFSKDAPFAKIAGYLSELVEDKTSQINMESLRVHVNSAIYNYKVAVILLHDRPETLLSYRIIAQNEELGKHFVFGTYKNPPEDLVLSTPQQKLPTMVVYYSQFNDDEEIDLAKHPIKVGYYNGNLIYHEMVKFFEEFIKTQIQSQTSHSEAQVNNLQYQSDLDKCKNNVMCVIGVIDQDQSRKRPQDEGKVDKPQPDHLGMLRRFKDLLKGDNIDVWYLDGFCHHDLLLDFGVSSEEVPFVMVVWWYKKEFAIYNESMSFDNVDLFLKRARRRAVKIEKLPKDWQMHKRNCAQYKQQVLEWQKRDAEKVIESKKLESNEELAKQAQDNEKPEDPNTSKTNKGSKSGGGSKKGRKNHWEDPDL